MALPTRVTIDGTEYETQKLSEEARNLLGSIQFVDNELARLNHQQNIHQTARNAYASRLTELLKQEKGAVAEPIQPPDDDVYPGEEEDR